MHAHTTENGEKKQQREKRRCENKCHAAEIAETAAQQKMKHLEKKEESG